MFTLYYEPHVSMNDFNLQDWAMLALIKSYSVFPLDPENNSTHAHLVALLPENVPSSDTSLLPDMPPLTVPLPLYPQQIPYHVWMLSIIAAISKWDPCYSADSKNYDLSEASRLYFVYQHKRSTFIKFQTQYPDNLQPFRRPARNIFYPPFAMALEWSKQEYLRMYHLWMEDWERHHFDDASFPKDLTDCEVSQEWLVHFQEHLTGPQNYSFPEATSTMWWHVSSWTLQ